MTSAVFTRAAVYQIKALCRTPLRTGSAEGDPDRILRYRDETPFVQGASLAGALREWLVSDAGDGAARALFGTQSAAGHLIVSDGVFDQTARPFSRPRLRIDPATASADSGKKFDMAHIGTGAVLRFSLTWLGAPEVQEAELSAVERMLAAMDAGEIRLGAQKSNGFGQLSLTAERRVFDLLDAGDREDWLAGRLEGSPISLPAPERREAVVFTVEGHSDNLLVKSVPIQYKDGSGKIRSYTPNLKENGVLLLPGSSVKGPVRARAAYIAELLGLDPGLVDRAFGRESRGEDNGLPGRILFEDAVLSNTRKRISRIHVDRFTGGVFRGGLFTEEPVCSDVTLRIAAPEEPEICALVLYALRDLALGLYSLGSGWAIGRGQIAVKRIQIAAPGNRTAALCFDASGKPRLEDPSGTVRAWLENLEEVRHDG